VEVKLILLHCIPKHLHELALVLVPQSVVELLVVPPLPVHLDAGPGLVLARWCSDHSPAGVSDLKPLL
jgi:hypothetical protein